MGEFYNEKCDVFSYAIIMFEVLAETNEPYGGTLGIEVRVSQNPTFRPMLPDTIRIQAQQEFFVDLMQQWYV